MSNNKSFWSQTRLRSLTIAVSLSSEAVLEQRKFTFNINMHICIMYMEVSGTLTCSFSRLVDIPSEALQWPLHGALTPQCFCLLTWLLTINVLLKKGQSSSVYGAVHLSPLDSQMLFAAPVAPACLLLLVFVRVSPLDKYPINSLVPLGRRTQDRTQTLERVSPPTFLHFASSWVGSVLRGAPCRHTWLNVPAVFPPSSVETVEPGSSRRPSIRHAAPRFRKLI